MHVRTAEAADVQKVVDVHLETFPGFFLSSLGRSFLRQFYAGLIELKSGVLLVAEDGSDVVGFVGGADEQRGFYRQLLRQRAVRFIVAALPAIIRRPSVVGRLIRGRRRAQGHDDTPEGACLMTIGVDPRVEGSGVGRLLVGSFEQALVERGSHGYCLTTDADGNQRTNRFYGRLGLLRSRLIVTAEGRRLNEYRAVLPRPETVIITQEELQ
jgi:ribosomal protein S18 acetylase RimI-like enzyme